MYAYLGPHFSVLTKSGIVFFESRRRYINLQRKSKTAGLSHTMKVDNSSIERVEEFKYLGTTLTNENSIQKEIKEQIEVRECLLPLFAEPFVFQFAIQKFKDQDI